MQTLRFYLLLLIPCFLSSCLSEPVQITDNTFLYKTKIYKVIDNELVELADVDAKQIRKFQVTKPQRKSLGSASIDFVKPGASVEVQALYRGNFLYYKVNWQNINDLRTAYYSGVFTINFIDEYGFILHSVDIPTSEMVARVNNEREVSGFEFSGKTEMSTDINAAIVGVEVGSTVKSNK